MKSKLKSLLCLSLFIAAQAHGSSLRRLTRYVSVLASALAASYYAYRTPENNKAPFFGTRSNSPQQGRTFRNYQGTAPQNAAMNSENKNK